MNPFRKYFLIALILALLNVVFILFFFFPRYNHSDTQEYFSAIKNLAGDKTAQVSPYRMLKPMSILIGVFLVNFTAVKNTLIIQNILFYFLFVVLTYLLVYKVYKNEKQAFYGAVLGMTAYPILAYGLASLTDLSGWLFFIISVLLSLEFLGKPALKTVILTGLISGFGMIFKESSTAGSIFFTSLTLFGLKVPFKEKIKYIFIFGLAFIIFPLINSIIIYKIYYYSYFDEFFHAGVGGDMKNSHSLYIVSPLRITIEIGRTFLLGWLFVVLGAWKEFFSKNRERLKILIAFLPPSLSFFLWIYPHNRMMFIAFPFLVLLGSFGLMRNYKNKQDINFSELAPLALYVIFNYFILEFFLRYGTVIQSPGTLFG